MYKKISFTETVSVGQTEAVSTYVLYYTPFSAELQVLLRNLQEKFAQISISTTFLGCIRDFYGIT